MTPQEDSGLPDQHGGAADAAAAPQPEAGADAPADSDAAPQTVDVDELNTRLQQAQAKADENWALYLSAKAEIDNARKRSERDVANARKFGVEKLLGELLPIKDSIELGISAAEETTDIEKLKEGNELTLKMLSGVLDKFGVQVIDPVGDKFNPERHEAMAMQPSADVEPNTVLQVVQKGYLLNERLVRPAMVIVSRA